MKSKTMTVDEVSKIGFVRRRDSLPPELEDQARRIWKIIEGYSFRRTFESFEHDFTFDANPDQELDEVERIALAWQDWCKDHPDASKHDKERALSCGYGVSVGVMGLIDDTFSQMQGYYKARGGMGKPISVIQGKDGGE